MSHGKVGIPVIEDFTSYDANNVPVTNLVIDDITVYVYNPNGIEVSDTVNIQFINMGNGDYRITYIPDIPGNWYCRITNPIIFPMGKANNTQVYLNDMDELSNWVKRILGLVQENFYIDSCQFDEHTQMTHSRIRIYDDKNLVGTESGVIGEYIMDSIYDESGNLVSYKVVKS